MTERFEGREVEGGCHRRRDGEIGHKVGGRMCYGGGYDGCSIEYPWDRSECMKSGGI